MAEAAPRLSDPLYCLRESIISNALILPSTSSNTPTDTPEDLSLALATCLHFTTPIAQSFELSTETRFISREKPVDLRSIYFAWLKKDVAIPEYIASAQKLNGELSAADGVGGEVRNLVFVERLDLITWLEGASDESEYIKPLETDASAVQAAGSAAVASGAAGGIATIPSASTNLRGRNIDPRLAEIYNGERKMGDRNTVLRGIKPMVCHKRMSS
jgi:parafibromin